ILHSHPAVADAAVIGIADERWGERQVAYVVANGDLDLEQLRELCRSELAGFKVPDAFYLIEELPLSSTGKIRKTTLRQLDRSLVERWLSHCCIWLRCVAIQGHVCPEIFRYLLVRHA